MAGSFNLFRRYQKAALAGLAIMAMLAFFVLPPLLQLGGGGAQRGDSTVVRWQGGGLRESGLQRAVLTRRALNQFLMALRAAATGDERVQPPLRDDEKGVVDALLLAREAEANGIVVSDTVINDFLAMWTGDMVTSAQMQNVIGQLRDRAGVTEADIFDALRTVILGERLQALALRGTGFSGAPPGWRWDAFRKLEQGATVEVVPVVVESLAGEVAEPSMAALEGLYARYRDDLPRARSATPGFREPARARYDALVARAGLFVAEAEKDVTDEQIAKFYDDNKERMFKQAPEPEPEPEAKPDSEPAADAKPAAEPAPEAPAEPAAAKEQPATPAEPSPEPEPAAEPQAAAGPSRPIVLPVAFRQPSTEAAQEAAETAVKETAPAAETAAAGEEKPAATEEKPAEPAAEAKAADEFQPLEKVRDEIRKQLASQAAEQKISEIFATITSRIAAHSDRVEEAIGLNEPLPAAPDVMKLAAEQGLEGVRSEFVTPAETVAAGGIGSSFLLAFSDRFGVRQQRWIDLIFAPDAPRFRPVVTRDVEGGQYLSWKTEDRPAFTPALKDIKPEVERVWRLIEARPLARKEAEELAAAAADKPLAEVLAGREGLAASTVGPFTWLTRGTAPFGSPPMRNDPEGIEMAGDEFLAAVFGLEPGQTAVAFNEPQTVCYAIKLAGLEPAEEVLQERFVEAANDPRRLAMLAEDETRDAFDRWLVGIEKRQGVEWLRDPR